MKNKEACLSRLPPELLLQCFQLLIDSDSHYNCPRVIDDLVYASWLEERDEERNFCLPFRRCRTAWALSLTCKSFNSMLQPMLYSNIDIVQPSHYLCFDRQRQEDLDRKKSRKRVRSFIKTFQLNPELFLFCRHLALNWDVLAHVSRKKKSEISYLRNVTHIEVVFPFAIADRFFWHRSWRACTKAIIMLPNLTELYLSLSSELDCFIDFGDIADLIEQIPTLRRLTVNKLDRDGILLDPGDMLMKDQAKPPADKAQTVSMCELCLRGFDQGNPDALKDFLQWPRRLDVLDLGSIGTACYSPDDSVEQGLMSFPWDFRILHDIVSPHKSTLRELYVRQLSTQDGLDQFNLHDFTALTVLKLCAIGIPPVEQALALWPMKSLRRLILDYSRIDSQQGLIWEFSESDGAWLTQFTRVAAKERIANNFPLCEIGIEYDERFLILCEIEAFKAALNAVESNGFRLLCPPGTLKTAKSLKKAL